MEREGKVIVHGGGDLDINNEGGGVMMRER